MASKQKTVIVTRASQGIGAGRPTRSADCKSFVGLDEESN